MKTLTLLLALSPAFAADCPKNSDACSGGAKSSSPFLAASMAAERVAADANKAAPAKPAAGVKAAKPSPAVPAAVSSASAAAVPAPASGKGSSPAWLLFIAGGLAGLYFYLSGGVKKGKRK